MCEAKLMKSNNQQTQAEMNLSVLGVMLLNYGLN